MVGSDGFLYSQLLNSFSKKRKLQREEEEEELEGDDLEEMIVASIQATAQIAANQCLRRKNRQQQKMFWGNGYENWDMDEFKGRLRINRETFMLILARVSPFISKKPTHFIHNPVEDHRQLAMVMGAHSEYWRTYSVYQYP